MRRIFVLENKTLIFFKNREQLFLSKMIYFFSQMKKCNCNITQMKNENKIAKQNNFANHAK